VDDKRDRQNTEDYAEDEEIEALLNEEDDETEFEPPAYQKWIKRMVALILSIVLFANILAFWPYVYHLDAVQFLIKSRELSKNANIQEYKKAVVIVKAADRKGTGFNVAESGLIITNEHVISGEEHGFISFPGGKKYRADVVFSDPAIDMAVLKIADEDERLPVLSLNMSYNAVEGEPVYIIGNPLFFYHIANQGEIAGVTPLKDWDLPVIALNAPIYKGNSGSPVINREGEVVAVVFATIKISNEEDDDKVGLAVPIQYIREQLEEFMR
jgi:serine protease Do